MADRGAARDQLPAREGNSGLSSVTFRIPPIGRRRIFHRLDSLFAASAAAIRYDVFSQILGELSASLRGAPS